MGKRLVIHPQTEENSPAEYVLYLRRVLREIPEVSEAILCGLKEFDAQGGYTGISVSRTPLPSESALSAIALRLDSNDDATFSRVSEAIQNRFSADGITGPVIFNGFKFPDIARSLKRGKALVAYQRRGAISLDSYQGLSEDLYRSIDRAPAIWNGTASYWFQWRTKEIIDVMRADSSDRLHVHVSPNINLVELSKRLLVLSDSVTFWHAGPIPALTVTLVPSPHPEEDIGKAMPSLTGVGRPLPPSLGQLLTEGRSAFLSGRLFYSPLAIIHAPPYRQDEGEISLEGLSEWVKNIDHLHAPATDVFVKDIVDRIGVDAWKTVEERSSQFQPGPIIDGWQTTLRNGEYLALEEVTWPLDKLLKWEADITEFCHFPSSYSACSEGRVDPEVWINVEVPYLDNVPLETLLRLQEQFKSDFDQFRDYILEANREAARDGTRDCAQRMTRKLAEESRRLATLCKRISRAKRYGVVDVFVRSFTLGIVLYATGGARSAIFGVGVQSVFDGIRERERQRKEQDEFDSQRSIFLWRLREDT